MSRQIAENPFYVLELRPDCTAHDVETQGQKILGMLELGLQAAWSYPTPLGPRARDAERVRLAMAQLRDPVRRGVHELWAGLDPAEDPPAGELAEEDPLAPWTGALSLLGK